MDVRIDGLQGTQVNQGIAIVVAAPKIPGIIHHTDWVATRQSIVTELQEKLLPAEGLPLILQDPAEVAKAETSWNTKLSA